MGARGRLGLGSLGAGRRRTLEKHIYIGKHTRAAVGHLGLSSLGVGADRLPAASAARHGRDVTAKG
jgi:hypothetical protein